MNRMRTWMRCGLAAVVLGGVACDGTSRLPERTEKSVAPEGGTLKSAGGEALLSVPPGAVPDAVMLSMETRRDIVHPRLASPIYDLGPDGYAFDAPVQFSIRVGPSDRSPYMVQYLDGRFIPVEGSVFADGVVTAPLHHFSMYGVVYAHNACENLSCGDACTPCGPDEICSAPTEALACDPVGRCRSVAEVSCTVSATVAPAWSLTPMRLPLQAMPGAEAQGELVLSNQGNGPGRVRALQLSPATTDFVVGSALRLPQFVDAGGSLRIPVVFAPVAAGTQTATLSVVTDEADLAVVLEGEAPNAPLTVSLSPKQIDFGTVGVGSRIERSAMLQNTTDRTLDVSIAFSSGGAPFSLRSPERQVVEVGPRASLPVSVQFAPTAAATSVRARLRFSWGPASFVTLSLQGAADQSPPVREESFRQHARPKGDILFVIDDSCSMEDSQARLAALGGGYIAELALRNIDYHIAATTTDGSADKAGRLRAPVVVSEASAAPEDDFADLARAGTYGSGTEAGIYTAVTALSAPPAPADLTRFLRDDAWLTVIVLSDEADQSGAHGLTVAEAADALRGLKPGTEQVRFNAVVGDANEGCQVGSRQVFPGLGYLELMDALGGSFSSICGDDWRNATLRLGGPGYGFRRHFTLAGVPTPGSVEVWVDDAPQANAAWRYDAAAGQIIFSTGALPPPGAEIRVRYRITPRTAAQFQQFATPRGDILFVLDNSGSMADDISRLVAAVPAWMAQLGASTDYQIGVITTDPASGGQLAAPIVDGTEADPAAALTQALGLPLTGGPKEEGLAMSVAALTEPLASGANAGLLRPHAWLTIVYVSDEDDQSVAPTSQIVDALRGTREVASHVTANGYLPVAADCGASAPGTPRYQDVIQAFGGVVSSICLAPTQALQQLGGTGYGLRTHFGLPARADLSVLEVRVNGAAADPSHWRYDGPTQAVIFDDAHAPPPGASIEITY